MTNREAERATDTLRDTKVPGLVLYVGAKCKTFYLYRRVDGRPQRIKLGRFPAMTVEQARKKALAVNAEIESGGYGKPTTFGELWKLHCEVKRAKRTLTGDEYLYNRCLKSWAGRRLDSITVGDCQRLHCSMSRTPYAANRVMALLGTMFNIAVKHGLRKDNPVRAVSKYREQSRDRFLTTEELPQFFTAVQACDRDFRDMVLLCLYTGARVGNVLKMDDEQIKGTTWTIPRTKNGRPQQVYLCPEAMAIIQSRELPLPYHGVPRKRWKALCKAAGLKNFRVHDLRRTLGSWQAATGASLPVIGKTLGHLTSSATQVYARLDLSPVRNAVDTAVKAMTGWYMVVYRLDDTENVSPALRATTPRTPSGNSSPQIPVSRSCVCWAEPKRRFGDVRST